MKKYFLILIVFISGQVHAQTGIGTTTPNASAKLDVYATNKGFLPPRVTLTSSTDASTIASPATGLLVYNTGTNAGLRAGYYYWNGTDWTTIATPVSSETVDYVSVTRNSSQTINTGDNIKFNVINGGNIPYDASTGNFTLTANKTYRLSGTVTLSTGNTGASEIDVTWRTAAGTNLGNYGMILSMNHTVTAAGNGISEIIYTPTTNTTVSFYTVWASTNATTQSNNVYATIEQIGSSAIINPWVLSGTTTYNTTGNVGIGNNSPTTALEVTGDTKVSGVLTAGGNAYPTTTGTSGYALTTNAAGTASWYAVPPVGVITAFAGSTAPTGYLIGDGAAVSRTNYAALFAIIGTTYGVGNGSTTFNVPDLTGRVPVGKNAGTFSTLGVKGGEETHTMTVNEMPSHKHTTSINSANEVSVINGYAASAQSMFFGTDRNYTTTNWSTAMQNTGGGAAFNVLQPYTVLNYIIKF